MGGTDFGGGCLHVNGPHFGYAIEICCGFNNLLLSGFLSLTEFSLRFVELLLGCFGGEFFAVAS
ncbi:MAG: hypothetical protein LH628_24230 [Microcoleus sp. CAN_BIN18]|nr:hypothetical protein [Microcoleus sp. CAN_BIN18]